MAQLIVIGQSFVNPARRQSLSWRANGFVSGYDVQPGSYNGSDVSNPAILASTGLFDATLPIFQGGSIVTLSLVQQVPATSPSLTTVEFYRVRGPIGPGQITSLGVVSLTNSSPFESLSSLPVVSDLLPGDLVFVSFAAAPTTDPNAAEVSAHMEIA